MSPLLHQLNPTTRFDSRANDYARYRPSYPAAAFDAILKGLAPATTLVAADIGAGTGISSRLLADRELTVWAVEPNAAMRGVATQHPKVTFVNAAAERTGLADASVDLVTAFQAFHWFDPVPALAEFGRILRPAGRLALVWNERDARDAFTAECGVAIREAAGDHPGLNRSGVELSAELFGASRVFRPARIVVVPNSKRMDLDALLGASLSASYIPRSGAAHDKLMADLSWSHKKYAAEDGCVEMLYRTEMLIAERV